MELLWNTNWNMYALYQMALFPVTLSDPNYPKSHHFGGGGFCPFRPLGYAHI